MFLTKDTYRKMNKAYNTLFDEWQNIEEMPPEVFQQMNMAMVMLDGVLDELKAASVDEDLPTAAPAATPPKKSDEDEPDLSGFKVFGGTK